MDERGANIDVLFRNGLKDYEVLPPPDVWDNIRPAVQKNQQPFIILRAAAMIAVVISLSFLAYRWSLEISSGLANNDAIINPESDAPVFSTNRTGILQNRQAADRLTLLSDASVPVKQTEEASIPVITNNDPQDIGYQPVDNNMPAADLRYRGRSILAVQNNQNPYSLTNGTELAPYSPETPANDIKERWTISALVSPTYYSTFLSGNNDLAGQLMADEKSRLSYSGGVAFSYKVSRRFSVQSGLYYSSFGQKLEGITSFGGFRQYDYTKGDHNFEVLTSNGTVYTSNADVFLLDALSSDRITTRYTNDVFDPAKANLQYIDNSLRQNFSYLELPVVLRYKIVDKGIDFNIIGGFSSNVLVNNVVYTNGGKYPIGKTEGLSAITFSSSLGMGMEYNISKNFSFNLEPTLRYYLNPFNEISGMKVHPYSFGVFSGLSYKF
jgi:hypothetical protein